MVVAEYGCKVQNKYTLLEDEGNAAELDPEATIADVAARLVKEQKKKAEAKRQVTSALKVKNKWRSGQNEAEENQEHAPTSNSASKVRKNKKDDSPKQQDDGNFQGGRGGGSFRGRVFRGGQLGRGGGWRGYRGGGDVGYRSSRGAYRGDHRGRGGAPYALACSESLANGGNVDAGVHERAHLKESVKEHIEKSQPIADEQQEFVAGRSRGGGFRGRFRVWRPSDDRGGGYGRGRGGFGRDRGRWRGGHSKNEHATNAVVSEEHANGGEETDKKISALIVEKKHAEATKQQDANEEHDDNNNDMGSTNEEQRQNGDKVRESSQKEEERKLLTFADFKALQMVDNVPQFDVRKVDVPSNMKVIPNKFDEAHDEYEIKVEIKPPKKKRVNIDVNFVTVSNDRMTRVEGNVNNAAHEVRGRGRAASKGRGRGGGNNEDRGRGGRRSYGRGGRGYLAHGRSTDNLEDFPMLGAQA